MNCIDQKPNTVGWNAVRPRYNEPRLVTKRMKGSVFLQLPAAAVQFFYPATAFATAIKQTLDMKWWCFKGERYTAMNLGTSQAHVFYF